MDRGKYSPESSWQPNPLRPYYVPPSIGTASPTPMPASAKISKPHSSVASSARDFLPDIDLDIKSSTSEAWQASRGLLDTLAWRYTSVLLAQPFDVVKTILQVSQPPSSSVPATSQAQKRPGLSTHSYSNSTRSRSGVFSDTYRESTYESDSDASDDIPDYFTSTHPSGLPTSPSNPRHQRRRHRHRSPSSPTPRSRHAHPRRAPSSTQPPTTNNPAPDASRHHPPLSQPDGIWSTLSALHQHSGAVGLWRATNTTFLYSILVRTTDSFLRSLLLTLLGLPDVAGPDHAGLQPGLSSPGSAGFSGLDPTDSPHPLAALLVVGLASGLTGLVLAPLDLVRTRLIVTPLTHAPRGLVQNLKRMGGLMAPTGLWAPTVLFHAVPSLFSAASPLVLRRYLRITPETTPGLWGLAAFVTTLTELFVRLPLETVLRRAQVKEIVSGREGEKAPALIVEPAPYLGVWGTVYSALYLEGETTTKAANGMVRKRKGQGVAGLVRGWQVGFWGLAGVWGAGALSPADVKTRGQF